MSAALVIRYHAIPADGFMPRRDGEYEATTMSYVNLTNQQLFTFPCPARNCDHTHHDRRDDEKTRWMTFILWTGIEPVEGNADGFLNRWW